MAKGKELVEDKKQSWESEAGEAAPKYKQQGSWSNIAHVQAEIWTFPT